MPLTLKEGDDDESFANPQPPPNYRISHSRNEESLAQPLTNADFRKLLMTPAPSTHRAESTIKTDGSSSKSLKKAKNDAAEKRKEKKLYYASLVKESKQRELELSNKYRDRAKERREVKEGEEFVSTTANFKAVAPDAKLEDNAERRRQIIEESKYLGGDLEHTHLVKGLDYALLQKIKAELDSQTKTEDEDLDKQLQQEEDEEEVTELAETSKEKAVKTAVTKVALSFKEPTPIETVETDDDTKIVFKSKLAHNIYRAAFKPPAPKTNELFLPRRMAYVIDLEDEETDIPVTLTRSKADCPTKELSTTLTTNDIVINKLTQILLYLRQGGKKDAKKLKKLLKGKIEDEMHTSAQQPRTSKDSSDLGIYDGIGDYVPDLTKRNEKKVESKSMQKQNYFDIKGEAAKPRETEKEQGPSKESAHAFIKGISEKYANKVEPKKEKEVEKKMIVNFDADSYAECYPGTRAEEDVNIDSDEEPEYDKMDMGNKKGAVGRFDFDTSEEYSSYMSNKEALPKAAFQFGVKTNDGRKTRRAAFDPKIEKAKIEKEWTQISQIIEKRKSGAGGSDYKKPKY